jgi:hypothetical protein
LIRGRTPAKLADEPCHLPGHHCAATPAADWMRRPLKALGLRSVRAPKAPGPHLHFATTILSGSLQLTLPPPKAPHSVLDKTMRTNGPATAAQRLRYVEGATPPADICEKNGPSALSVCHLPSTAASDFALQIDDLQSASCWMKSSRSCRIVRRPERRANVAALPRLTKRLNATTIPGCIS